MCDIYTEESFKDEIYKMLKNPPCWISSMGQIELYCDQNDRLSDKQVVELFADTPRHDCGEGDPRTRFDDLLSEWAWDYASSYGDIAYGDIVYKHLSLEAQHYFEEHKDDAIEVMDSIFEFYYPERSFDREVLVNILLNTGNGSYDFTLDDVFSNLANGTFKEGSSLLFLARAQGLESELKKAAADYYNTQSFSSDSRFVTTAIEEMQNNGSYMNTATFCVKMSLFELFRLWDMVCAKKGSIVLSKNSRCGLFNPFDGGGSLMEIELDKDVEIPCSLIHKAAPDGYWHYDVKDVYGVCDSFWRGNVTLKENVDPEKKTA